MKYIAIILSILTITLSSIPCDDEIAVSEQSVVASQSSDTHSRDLTDLCTPFCSCVCCATIILEQTSQQNISAIIFSSSKLSGYINTIHSSDFLDEILHPPRA